jgi:hypothetical protein
MTNNNSNLDIESSSNDDVCLDSSNQNDIAIETSTIDDNDQDDTNEHDDISLYNNNRHNGYSINSLHNTHQLLQQRNRSKSFEIYIRKREVNL